MSLAVFAALAFWNLEVEPNHARVYLIISAVAALLWMENVVMPRRLGYLIMWLASHSYYIYIVRILPSYIAKFVPKTDSIVVNGAICTGVILVSVVMAFVIGQMMALLESLLRSKRQALLRRVRNARVPSH